MSLSKDFEYFSKNILLDNLSDMERTTGEIAKKLNCHYYNIDEDSDSHMYIVGSVGRKTAIINSSDLDILFELPSSVFKKYDAYQSNGQSALIQDVKTVIQERYPKSDISGDGQVVVIAFNKYIIELVPGFKQSDDRFKYPDTHDGGSWKFTDPLSEQKECENCNSKSNGSYYDFCHIIRCWKNTIDFTMGGLLIDTLIYNFFKDNDYFGDKSTDDYLQILTDLYGYLKNQNPDQSYWYAVGSNQQVKNADSGRFVSKAKEAYEKLNGKTNTTDGINDALRELLGNDFPKGESKKGQCEKCAHCEHKTFNRAATTEQFIEELVPVDIRYFLQIDCEVSQNGWRPFFLREFLKRGNEYLQQDKKLDFYISETNCPWPYEIWWKVRNVGPEAQKRNMVRGSIEKTNDSHHREHTNFYGPHYVECFLIKNGICVARDCIDVPIGFV